MKRRVFIQKGALTGSFLGIGGMGLGHAFAKAYTEDNNTINSKPSHTFNLNYAPHLGMFKTLAGDDPIDQLKFMASQGFTAFEDNEMRNRPIAQQEAIAATMKTLGMTMGAFVGHKIYWTEPNLTSGKQHYREEFLNDIKAAINVAKRVNAKWITVVPGHVDLGLNMDFQTVNVVEILKQAAAILEPHKITMVLEPLYLKKHLGLFLATPSQAYQLCKAIASPSCKMLFDIYHQQTQGDNILSNIELYWDEIAYFQIGDNPDRNEPTSGEINYKNVLKYIHSREYTGILGMEHGNSIAGATGEQRVIDAYVESDGFL